MNYISEINNFYDWLETNPISDSAIVLWHALMHVNNRCGWKPEFAVAISTIQNKTTLSKSSIIRARKVLVETGRITFKTRGGQQSSIYSMLACHTDTQTDTQKAYKAGSISDNRVVEVHTDTQTDTLNSIACHTDTQSGTQTDTLESLACHTDTQTDTILKLNNITKKRKPFFKIAGELFELSPSERINSDHSYATDTFMTGIFRGIQKEEILKRLDAEYMGYEFRDEMHLRNSFKTIGEKIKTESKPKANFYPQQTQTVAAENVTGRKPRGAVRHD